MFEIEVVTTKKKLTKSLLEQLPRCDMEKAVSVIDDDGKLYGSAYWIKLPKDRKVYLIRYPFCDWNVFEDYEWHSVSGIHIVSECKSKSVRCYSEEGANKLFDQYCKLEDLTANNQLFI